MNHNTKDAYKHTVRTSTRCFAFDNRSEFARLRAAKEQSVDKRLFCIIAPTHPLCNHLMLVLMDEDKHKITHLYSNKWSLGL